MAPTGVKIKAKKEGRELTLSHDYQQGKGTKKAHPEVTSIRTGPAQDPTSFNQLNSCDRTKKTRGIHRAGYISPNFMIYAHGWLPVPLTYLGSLYISSSLLSCPKSWQRDTVPSCRHTGMGQASKDEDGGCTKILSRLPNPRMSSGKGSSKQTPRGSGRGKYRTWVSGALAEVAPRHKAIKARGHGSILSKKTPENIMKVLAMADLVKGKKKFGPGNGGTRAKTGADYVWRAAKRKLSSLGNLDAPDFPINKTQTPELSGGVRSSSAFAKNISDTETPAGPTVYGDGTVAQDDKLTENGVPGPEKWRSNLTLDYPRCGRCVSVLCAPSCGYATPESAMVSASLRSKPGQGEGKGRDPGCELMLCTQIAPGGNGNVEKRNICDGDWEQPAFGHQQDRTVIPVTRNKRDTGWRRTKPVLWYGPWAPIP
ncbi:hypothetical protein QBC37DRAFT_405374 [Rhypophila decipiens]|uniref:Uncharacterized protein n=1 Tax=Rhypophila decipiens TaxID=261697 RepID=A0AAN7B2Z1_9PEZI|nr:hypothetical protein QBC37DRAFT_405374 [Rhypophila decipiens]